MNFYFYTKTKVFKPHQVINFFSVLSRNKVKMTIVFVMYLNRVGIYTRMDSHGWFCLLCLVWELGTLESVGELHPYKHYSWVRHCWRYKVTDDRFLPFLEQDCGAHVCLVTLPYYFDSGKLVLNNGYNSLWRKKMVLETTKSTILIVSNYRCKLLLFGEYIYTTGYSIWFKKVQCNCFVYVYFLLLP